MPAISVDTFFACSLMVLLVLSSMAGVSKLLYLHINNASDENIVERYREVSKYLLLNEGTPSNWGQNSQLTPETFGLAKSGVCNPYELDIDKVSRLNDENLYAISYSQLFTTLRMSDASLRIEIKPVFEITINLTSTFEETNETVYQFEISTEKHGVPVQALLKYYVVAENFFEANHDHASNGRTYLNVTLSNDVNGPALLAIFARSVYNTKIVSFNVYAFAHNLAEPKPKGTFLRLSPLNYTLNASFTNPETILSDAYVLTFNYFSILTQTTSNNQSAMYAIPSLLDSSPLLIVLTGWNSTFFFTEWTAYPQIPLQVGADFATSAALSDVYTFTFLVTINSAFYECTVWLGGPKE